MRSDRTSRTQLIGLLTQAGAQVRGAAFLCPWHQDHTASGSVFPGDDGHWRWRCHACGAHGDVWDVEAWLDGRLTVLDLQSAVRRTARLGTQDHQRRAQPAGSTGGTLARAHPRRPHWPSLDALARHKAEQAHALIEARHSYLIDGATQPVLVVLRLRSGDGHKTFRMVHQDGDGWIDAAPARPWPLFHLVGCAAAQRVVMVEGEKATEALWGVGIVSTTTAGGAGHASASDLTPLCGKQVVLWPDHDAAGARHMDDVERRLALLHDPPSVSRIDPATVRLPPKGDAVDFLAQLAGDHQAKAAAVTRLIDAAVRRV